MNKKILLFFMIISILIFQVPLKTSANTYGGRWNKDIRMYIESSDSSVVGNFGIAKSFWNKALAEANSSVIIFQVY